MKVIVIDRDSLKKLCETRVNILPNIGETVEVQLFNPTTILRTELIKREWVVTDGSGVDSYVLLIVKTKSCSR